MADSIVLFNEKATGRVPPVALGRFSTGPCGHVARRFTYPVGKRNVIIEGVAFGANHVGGKRESMGGVASRLEEDASKEQRFYQQVPHECW